MFSVKVTRSRNPVSVNNGIRISSYLITLFERLRLCQSEERSDIIEMTPYDIGPSKQLDLLSIEIYIPGS